MPAVVLDSTVLVSAGPSSGPLRDLALCVKIDEDVRIHVPELVIREVATNIAQKAVASEVRGLVALAHWDGTPEVKDAIDTVKGLKADRDQIVDRVRDAIETWVESIAGVMVPISSMDPEAVFDDYFLGRGPFKDAAKERTRIPDAFIFHYVKDLLDELRGLDDEVLVVTSDKALSESLGHLAGVRVFPTISDLLTRSGIQSWMRVGDLRVQNGELEALIDAVGMQVVLPGPPVYVENPSLEGVTLRLIEATEKDGVVYVPFEIVFPEVTVIVDGAPLGEADQSISVGPVKTTGTARGELRTDPDGNRFVMSLVPASVTTYAPPGFEEC